MADKIADAVRADRTAGKSFRAIARERGIALSTVQRVLGEALAA